MRTFPNHIADICKTEKTTSLVSRSIPILIRWAQSGVTTNTYGDLIKELGMVRFSGIGYTLGCIEDVIAHSNYKMKKGFLDAIPKAFNFGRKVDIIK